MPTTASVNTAATVITTKQHTMTATTVRTATTTTVILVQLRPSVRS